MGEWKQVCLALIMQDLPALLHSWYTDVHQALATVGKNGKQKNKHKFFTRSVFNFQTIDFYSYLWSGGRIGPVSHPWPLNGAVDSAKLVSHRDPLVSQQGTEKDSSWST